MKDRLKDFTNNVYESLSIMVKWIFLFNKENTPEKLLSLYNKHLLQSKKNLTSIHDIDMSSVSFGEINYDFEKWTTWEITWEVFLCSPYYIAPWNEKWEITINFFMDVWVKAQSILEYKSLGSKWDIPFYIWGRTSGHQFYNHYIWELLWKDKWDRENYKIKDNIIQMISDYLKKSVILQQMINKIVHEKISTISLKELKKESEMEKLHNEITIFEKYWVLQSHNIYTKKKNWYDWWKTRNKIVQPDHKYWKEVTLAESQDIEEELSNENKLFFLNRIIAFWWWAYSKKIDFLKEKWICKKILKIDKSEHLLLHQNNGHEDNEIIYWDYTFQDSIKAHWVDWAAFIWWDLWNQHELNQDVSSFGDLIVAWVERYFDQALSSKPNGWKELLSFFSDETSEKNFIELYSSLFFKEILFQTIADLIDRSSLWVDVSSWVPEFWSKDRLVRENLLNEYIEYTPELWEKHKIWRLSRLWFTIKKWKSLPFIFNGSDKTIIKNWWDYITVNPTIRFNKKYIKQLVYEKWWTIVFERKVKHKHWMYILWCSHEWLLHIDDAQKWKKVLEKRENKDRIVIVMDRYKRLLLSCRLTLAVLLSSWIQELIDVSYWLNKDVEPVTIPNDVERTKIDTISLNDALNKM